jgi:hypothetical protein
MKTLCFTLKSELYPHAVVFYVGSMPSRTTIHAICTKAGLCDENDEIGDVSSVNGSGCVLAFDDGCFVWLHTPTKKNKPFFHATVAHEMIHIIISLSKAVSSTVCGENDEMYAYYVGWLVDNLYERLEKAQMI